MMTANLLIPASMVLVSNFVLLRILGLRPHMVVSNRLKDTYGTAVASFLVLALACASSFLIYHHLLQPSSIGQLSSPGFILAMAATLQLTEMLMRKTHPVSFRILGIYLPLIATNCAILGVALFNVQEHRNLLQAMLFGFGAATGFGLVLILFIALRAHVAHADVPRHFRGVPIGLITAGLMALALMGFSGFGRL